VNLDSRIKDILYIADCFTTDNYQKYIGTECYLTNEISNFANLDNCTKGKLDAVYDDSILPYGSDSRGFKFCLASVFVEQKQTELRPFTLEEFKKKYFYGEYITFRLKDRTRSFCLPYNGNEHMSETENYPDEDSVHLGAYAISLQDLFDDYEYKAGDEWKPFGVEK
jgi:hypothetical protein